MLKYAKFVVVSAEHGSTIKKNCINILKYHDFCIVVLNNYIYAFKNVRFIIK